MKEEHAAVKEEEGVKEEEKRQKVISVINFTAEIFLVAHLYDIVYFYQTLQYGLHKTHS